MNTAATERRQVLPPQWRTLATLAVAVTLAHLWLAGTVLPDRLGEGAADTRPRRIDVAFVRELAPAAPLPVAAAVARPRPRAAAPAAASSAPSAAASAVPEPPAPEAQASAPEPIAPTAALDPASSPQVPAPEVEPPAGIAAAAAGSAPSPAASSGEPTPPSADFEWPPSTRLSYRLTGNYRGPVEGQAKVEWLRSGTRYQVHMELSVGPEFSPLMSRRVSSEGEITPEGLRPRRYDEESRVMLREPRRLVIFLDADRVRLPDGSEQPRPPGVQDSASQFVQLTWLFTTQPALLRPGVSIDMPLALPRRMQNWTYDVLGADTLPTPAGNVPALHLKPRRPARPGSDLTAEIWVAPSLQYLPVRILVRQDAETYVDLIIERLPEQAMPGR